jgi:hypothetical protein
MFKRLFGAKTDPEAGLESGPGPGSGPKLGAGHNGDPRDAKGGVLPPGAGTVVTSRGAVAYTRMGVASKTAAAAAAAVTVVPVPAAAAAPAPPAEPPTDPNVILAEAKQEWEAAVKTYNSALRRVGRRQARDDFDENDPDYVLAMANLVEAEANKDFAQKNYNSYQTHMRTLKQNTHRAKMVDALVSSSTAALSRQKSVKESAEIMSNLRVHMAETRDFTKYLEATAQEDEELPGVDVAETEEAAARRHKLAAAARASYEAAKARKQKSKRHSSGGASASASGASVATGTSASASASASAGASVGASVRSRRTADEKPSGVRHEVHPGAVFAGGEDDDHQDVAVEEDMARVPMLSTATRK